MDHRAGLDAAFGTSHSSFRPIANCSGSCPRELEPVHELLREVAAHAVAEDRDLRQDLDAGLELAFCSPCLPDAAIAGADADRRASRRAALPSGEPGKQIDAFLLDLLGQPLARSAFSETMTLPWFWSGGGMIGNGSFDCSVRK